MCSKPMSTMAFFVGSESSRDENLTSDMIPETLTSILSSSLMCVKGPSSPFPLQATKGGDALKYSAYDVIKLESDP